MTVISAYVVLFIGGKSGEEMSGYHAHHGYGVKLARETTMDMKATSFA